MNGEPVKVCPECAGEYQLTAALCADCGVPLVFPNDLAARDAREIRLIPGMAHVRTAPILWVRALAAELDRAGIPYAIDRRKAREEGLLRIYVLPPDRDAAAEIDAIRLRIDPLETDEGPAATPRDERDSAPDYKVCPQCGSEYRPEIARCADCGVELVEPAAMEEAEEEDHEKKIAVKEDALSFLLDPPFHELPESDDLVCFGWGNLDSIALLSLTLDEAGIGHRIDRGPYEWRPDRACLYLRREDCEAAERIAENPEAESDELEAVEEEARACAACGASLPHGAIACSECGLEFHILPSGQVACPRCGAVGIYEERGCPNCGAALPEP
jgi:predicted amidophosphoribosyltransferase